MARRDRALLTLVITTLRHREFGFVDHNAPPQLHLAELTTPQSLKFLHLVRYDPFADKPEVNVCATFPGINVIVEYFVARIRPASRSARVQYQLSTREFEPRRTPQPPRCSLDEGIDRNITLFMLARRRPARTPRIPWRTFYVPLERIPRGMRRAIHNMSVTARGTLAPK